MARRRRYLDRDRTGVCLAVPCALVALLIVAGIVFQIVNSEHVEERTCTVTGKDRAYGRNGSDARIYTADCGVLRVGDSLASWNFRSADTYARIRAGHRYRFETRGWRIPFLSRFPNIVKVTEVAR